MEELIELQVDAPSAAYKIYYKSSFDALAEVFEKEGFAGRKICVVSDSNVAKLFYVEVKKNLADIADVYGHIFPAGEENKNLDAVKDIYDFLLRNRFDRKSIVVALGGGVVGDVAGFAAATFMRGIPHVQIPTTLLAKVDSSVGGKTGVDFKGAKNIVGAFWQPSFVYENIKTLETLDARQFNAGMAEAIKHGLIYDKNYFDFIFENKDRVKAPEVLKKLVYGSNKIKAEIVSKDEKETGLREILNFGHTFGHAIETLSGFCLLHGEAVAAGMICALKYSGVSDSGLLKYFDLDIKFKSDQILETMLMDKKVKNNIINIVYLEKLGKAKVRPVSKKELAEFLETV
jgi:3-dehydroquinate synthase